MPPRATARAALLTGAVLGIGLVPGVASAAPGDTRTVATCTESALRTAISEAPDGGAVEITCDDPILLTPGGGSTIIVDKTLTISGTVPGVVIDGGQQTSLFAVQTGGGGGLPTLTLRDLTLTGGRSADQGFPGGGAVWNLAHLVAERVAFTDNHAFNRGGAILSTGGGSTTVVDSTFTGNTVTCPSEGSGGGAIATRQAGQTTITRSTFTDNSAVGLAAGGAVLAWVSSGFSGMPADPPPTPLPPHALGGPVVVSDSTFTGNTVSIEGGFALGTRLYGGGALASFDHPLTVTDTVFSANSVLVPGGIAHGGAVLAGSIRDTPTTLTTVDVVDGGFPDEAPGPGGISLYATNGLGGGVALYGTPATVDDTVIAGNRALGGGGLYTRGGPVEVAASSIEGNTAGGKDPDPAGNHGGGIATFGPLTLTDTAVRGNTGGSCRMLWPDATPPSGDLVVDGGGNEVDDVASCFRIPVPSTPPPATGSLTAPSAPTEPGDPVALSGGGFAPHARVTLAAYPVLAAAAPMGTAAAAPTPVDLGAAPADAAGMFSATPVLPGAGIWRVVALGLSPSGTPVTLQSVVVVTAAGTDVAPVVTQQPSSASGAVGTAVSLTAAAAGAPAPTVRWQRSTDGGSTWTDVPGASGTSLTVSVVEGSVAYRAVFTNAAGTAVTAVAVVSGPGGGSTGGGGAVGGGGPGSGVVPVGGGSLPVAGSAGSAAGNGWLAKTGADLLPLAGTGVALVLAGAALVLLARRRKTQRAS